MPGKILEQPTLGDIREDKKALDDMLSQDIESGTISPEDNEAYKQLQLEIDTKLGNKALSVAENYDLTLQRIEEDERAAKRDHLNVPKE